MLSSLIRKHHVQESLPCLSLFVSMWLCEGVMVGAVAAILGHEVRHQ